MRRGTASAALVALAGMAGLIDAPPSSAQSPEDTCARQLDALEVALAAEGARHAVFAEHLALVLESRRRGEHRLCLDLAEDLLRKLREFEA